MLNAGTVSYHPVSDFDGYSDHQIAKISACRLLHSYCLQGNQLSSGLRGSLHFADLNVHRNSPRAEPKCPRLEAAPNLTSRNRLPVMGSGYIR